MSDSKPDWFVFRGSAPGAPTLPEPPPWRRFGGTVRAPTKGPRGLPEPSGREKTVGEQYQADDVEIEMVNAALVLRRPLLVTGKPGTGKSSLAYAVAHDLGLGPVLRWPITSRSTLKDGLYSYDVLGRLQEQQLHPDDPPDISDFLRLGPLGTALAPADRPRVLLIDEIDKSDIDLPNDLLHVFEEGTFDIPELTRMAGQEHGATDIVEIRTHDDGCWLAVDRGRITCKEFPFVVLTSNGERDFPPAFLRRCLRLTLPEPSPAKLAAIVQAHLSARIAATRPGPSVPGHPNDWEILLDNFETRRREHDLATDQLLNALYIRLLGAPARGPDTAERRRLDDALLKPLTGGQAT